MSRHDPTIRLLHMRDFARKAVAMAKDRTREDLEGDEMLELALTRLVELIGEAANQVRREVQDKYPEIPWEDIVGMRHHLVHGYEYVDRNILWDAITNNLPALVEELEKIVPEQQGPQAKQE